MLSFFRAKSAKSYVVIGVSGKVYRFNDSDVKAVMNGDDVVNFRRNAQLVECRDNGQPLTAASRSKPLSHNVMKSKTVKVFKPTPPSVPVVKPVKEAEDKSKSAVKEEAVSKEPAKKSRGRPKKSSTPKED